MDNGTTGSRTCKGCSCTKPLTDYYRSKQANGKIRFTWLCKLCHKRKVNERYHSQRAADPEAMIRNTRRWALSARFNLTVQQYDEMVDQQNNLCLICGDPPAQGKRLHIDHSHETGEVRALLCGPCNRHLGWAEKVGLQPIADYLDRAGTGIIANRAAIDGRRRRALGLK